MKETKAFYKTSEFWLLVIGQLILTLQTSDVIDLTATKYNWIIPILQTILASAYIVSRGKAKSGVPVTDLPVISEGGIGEFDQPTLHVPTSEEDVPVDTVKEPEA
jgi:hypothetical protein